MIEKETIEHIKKSVDLAALVRAKGVKLKKNGKSYFGLCPFHDDHNPSLSINPTTNLWHCFGCGAGGDVIRFVEMFDQVDFKEAVNRLSACHAQAELSANSCQLPVKNKKQNRPNTKNKTTGLTAGLLKLLNRVIEFYHTAFCEDPRAKEYLIKRGITDNAVFADFKAGFANGTLLNTLPSEGDIFEQLKLIGVLTGKGNEHFYGYVTFPIYDFNGNPAGIYGRRIDDMISGDVPDHLYLPGERHGLFNRQAAKAHKEIILTESIIDSLTLINAGIRNTIPCFGTNGLTPDHVRLLKQSGVETVYICFDADESGRMATESVSSRLQAENIRTYPVALADGQDINDFFLLTQPAAGQAEFKKLLNQANPNVCAAEGHAGGVIKKEDEKEKVIKTDYGFTMTIKDRKYEVRGLSKNNSKLKATVKGILYEKTKKRLHVDTVDFYSARSRNFLVKGLCDLFGADESTIAGDVERLLELAESYQRPEQIQNKEQMTALDKKAALAFLKKPDMFEEILTDFETLGYTGEEMNKLLCYIAAISRKQENLSFKTRFYH